MSGLCRIRVGLVSRILCFLSDKFRLVSKAWPMQLSFRIAPGPATRASGIRQRSKEATDRLQGLSATAGPQRTAGFRAARLLTVIFHLLEPDKSPRHVPKDTRHQLDTLLDTYPRIGDANSTLIRHIPKDFRHYSTLMRDLFT